MHDNRRQVGDLRHVADQLVRLKESVVHEVVALDARNGQCPLRLGEAIDYQRVRPQRGSAPFPGRPGLGRVHLGNLIVAGQALVESLDQVTALLSGDRCDVVLPVIGEHTAGASLVEPFDFLWPTQENPAQDQAMNAFWMSLGIGQ
ncbi:hypothetical protein D9M71_570580 [compost metagenome]